MFRYAHDNGDQTENRRNECVCVRCIINRLFFSFVTIRHYYLLQLKHNNNTSSSLPYAFFTRQEHWPQILLLFTQCKKKKTAIITQRAPVLNGISIITVGRTRSVFVNDRGVMVFWLSLLCRSGRREYYICAAVANEENVIELGTNSVAHIVKKNKKQFNII